MCSVGVLVLVLPLAFFVAASQLLVASFARSFKEAQTYLSLMIFLPMLPAILLSMTPVKSTLWMTAVPLFGQQVLLADVIRGEPTPPGGFALAALASLLLAAVCVALTAKLFQRERIVYGR